MKIVVINGTSVKGVTNHMKNLFLENMGENNEVTEFYPKDYPEFCLGCKKCFLQGEDKCPHYDKKGVIWNEIISADLLVFAYPVYALRVPASIKSLLDHFCVHWMVHRPEEKMFKKTAVIITNSIGAFNTSAQKDVKTSLSWMGVSKVYTCGAQMMGDISIDTMTTKHKKMLNNKMKKLSQKVLNLKQVNNMSLSVAIKFAACKFEHKMVLKYETEPSLDTDYFIDKGWIKPLK